MFSRAQKLVPLPHHKNPIHTLRTYLSMIHFNIFPIYAKLLRIIPFLQTLQPNFVRIYYILLRATWTVFLILLDLIFLIISNGEYKLWRFSLCISLSSAVNPSFSGTLYSGTPCSQTSQSTFLT